MGLFFNFSHGCASQDQPVRIDRKPAVAGRFYPADARELRNTLANLFSAAKTRTSGNVTAIVCPHAGYVFSGKVAASGYNQVDPERQFDNVFVIASSHQVSFSGASVYNQGDYVTPLGKVIVNLEVANELIASKTVFTYNPEADRTEHSLEVQIPFLQYHLKTPFKLVPVVLGTQSEETCRKIASALKPWFNDRNLFVFSTDFSHYPSYSDAQSADKATCEAIVSGSPEELLNTISRYRNSSIPNLSTNLCGWTSVLVMLNLTGDDSAIKIAPVQYMNSGDTPYGDKDQVVGYWSLAVSRPLPAGGNPPAFQFTRAQQVLMLGIARETLETYIKRKIIPGDDPDSYDDRLKIHAGAFVSLKKNGELRGCIGRFSADIPLYRLIREMTVASSTDDSRFDPVTADELGDVEIEISVLSPMKRISSPDEIILGKHGVYIRKGYSSGTFLPQVASETGWTAEEFLGHCARDKAGIGWDGWKDAQLYTYEAFVFSENELNGRKD